MSKYTVRITNDERGILAWIDQDGLKCIMQPNIPGEDGTWSTETEASTWANQHALELETQYETAVAAKALEEERATAQHAANIAIVALLERLTNP